MLKKAFTLAICLAATMSTAACTSSTGAAVRTTPETLYVTDRTDDFTGARTVRTSERIAGSINYDVLNPSISISMYPGQRTTHLFSIDMTSTRTSISANGLTACQQIMFLADTASFTVSAEGESSRQRTVASVTGSLSGDPTRYSFHAWLSQAQLSTIVSASSVRFRTCAGDGAFTAQNLSAFRDAYARVYQ